MESLKLNKPESHDFGSEELVPFMELVAEDDNLREEVITYCKRLKMNEDLHPFLDSIPEWHCLIGSNLPEGAPTLDVLHQARHYFIQDLNRFIERHTRIDS